MSGPEARFAARLSEAIGAPALRDRLGVVGEPFLVRRAGDESATRLQESALRGVGRVVATSAESARLLAARPELLERLADASGAPAEALEKRAAELEGGVPDDSPLDLEDLLDALRLLRREETLFAACLDLAGEVAFPDVSRFLSVLAEHVVRRALARARQAAAAREAAPRSFAVIGMGKVGGREFTYHSDLDLIFLHGGGPDEIVRVSRLGQRLVSYLATTTRAGVAYAVDMRLRPSGNQGPLVTSFDAWARYQREEAQLWEHLVLMRARPIAGDTEPAQAAVEGLRDWVLRTAEPPWPGVEDMRRRVERERGGEGDGRIALKTGPGGLMDVDFLAAGGLLERGAELSAPSLPSNAAMLRAAAPRGAAERVLVAYDLLRRVEARARFVSGRAVEHLEPASETFEVTAEVLDLEPRSRARAALAEALAGARGTIRSAWRRVVDARSIGAL